MHNRRLVAATLALLAAGGIGGCTKLVPASIDDFGANKTVVVTLRDGETIQGHIRKGEPVGFTTFGRVYRASIEDLDNAGNLVLSRPYLQEEFERYSLQRERMEGGPLRVTDGTERISIPAYKIVKVEEVTVDRSRTIRAAGFWTFTIFVVSKIMGARL